MLEQKIKISPRRLAEQLPDLRLEILQTYEDDIHLSGLPLTAGAVPETKPAAPIGSPVERWSILHDHPELHNAIPEKQLSLASAMWKSQRTAEDLMDEIYGGPRFYSPTEHDGSNLIFVLLKNLRATLERRDLPFQIKKSGLKPYFYSFVHKDDL